MTVRAEPATNLPNPMRRVGRGIRLNLVGAVVQGLTSFALVVIVARELSRRDAGLVFTATALFTTISVLIQLGTRTGLVYWIARMRALDTPELIPQCVRTGLRPVAVAGCIGGAALAIGGIVWNATGPTADAASLARQLWVLAPFLPLSGLSDASLAATRGFGTMKPTVVVENIWRNSVQLAFTAVAAALTNHLWVISFAWAVPYAGSVVWASIRLRRLTRRTLAGRPAATERPVGFTARFWRFTAPRALASLAQTLLQRLDIVLVAALRGPAAAAVYTAATRLLVSGQLGGTAISGSVQPTLAEALSAKDVPKARVAYQTATCWLVLLTWPFYLLSIVDIHLFLEIFGRGYTTATGVGILLAFSMLIATACGMVDLVLTMGGKTTWNLANVLGALTINVTLDIILIPPYGIMGAAIGWAAAIVFNNVVPLAQIWHVLKLQPFGRPTVLALGLSSAVFVIIPWSVAAIAGRDLVPSLVAMALATAVYGVFVVVLWDQLRLADVVPSWLQGSVQRVRGRFA
jgi:O-antigen/teichoic acid export membrane protein